METSLYPSHSFSFQSSSMNFMESQQIHLLLEPNYIEKVHECSSMGPAFSFLTEEPTCPNVVEDGFFDDAYMERLLEMEADPRANLNDIAFEVDSLMDFKTIHQDTPMGIENDLGIELGSEMNQENQEPLVLMEENSHLMGIHDELLGESSLTDLLLTGAEAVEAENWPLASSVIARLNSLLFDRENAENQFNRLAFFFTQGLKHKSFNAPEFLHEPVPRQADTMTAFQMIQELSPYVKFAHFAANQAILEASQGEKEIHVIDFDVMEGIQWPPLMIDLALRKDTSLRLTAIIDDSQNVILTQQTGRRLKEFADSINLPFRFDQVVMEKEEDVEGIEVGHTLIVNCMIHQLHMPSRNFSLVKSFLGGVSRLSPKMVVLVEEELFNFTKIPYMSFVEFFCEAIHHYTALCDSLMSSFCGGYKVGLRLIEKEYLGIRILDCVRQFPCERKERKLWGDVFSSLKGFKPIPMSSYNIAQAKFLVSLFNGGYWVQHEKCRLALCWKSRPLTTASIWVPTSNS